MKSAGKSKPDRSYFCTETLTLTPDDARWVGAWWLGYLIAGTVTLISAVPFWFLPKSLPVPVDKHDLSCSPEQTRFITDSPNLEHKFRQEEPPNLQQMLKGLGTFSATFSLVLRLWSSNQLFLECFSLVFLFSPDFVPTLKSLFGNPVYIIYLCVTILQFNSLIGMVTYKPKYIEQHYGQSASTANFLVGEQSFIYTYLIHDFGFLWTISLFGALEACSCLCCHILRKLFKDTN